MYKSMYRRDFLSFIGAAAVSCVGVASLSGCSGSASKKSDEYGTRTVRVSTGGEGEPYSFIDSNGTWTGLCADLWNRVGEITGWTIETVDSGSADAALSDLMSGKADVAANGFSITEKRLQLYLACDPLFADAQVVAVKSDSNVESLEELRGGVVGVVVGQATQATLGGIAANYGWNVKDYSAAVDAGKDCAQGAISAYADTIINVLDVQRTQGIQLKTLSEAIGGSNITWFTLSSNKDLRDSLNKVIKVMLEDGSLSELTTKWFNGDLTGYISDKWPKANK